MGRKKTSERIEHEVFEGAVAQPINSGKEYVVLKKTKRYTFKNLLPSMIFFTREDSTTGMFEGFETKDDITEKERKILINNVIFKEGTLVEDIPVEEDEIENNPNSLNDHKLTVLVNKYKNDTKYLQSYIDAMDSEFAIRRIRDAFVKNDLPSSLLTYCDFKLKQLEEEFLASKKAPVDETGKPQSAQ